MSCILMGRTSHHNPLKDPQINLLITHVYTWNGQFAQIYQFFQNLLESVNTLATENMPRCAMDVAKAVNQISQTKRWRDIGFGEMSEE
jgi:hypothetical protein